MRNLSLYLTLPFLLASCVNPTTNQRSSELEPETANGSPAQTEEDFMRIIGDLRWDKFTTAEDWLAAFPGCLKIVRDKFDTFVGVFEQSPRGAECKGVDIGGLTLYPALIQTAKTTGTPSGTMTASAFFKITDISQKRAFKTAIENTLVPSNSSSQAYCSKYTCWSEKTQGFEASPSDYAISVLDNVQVDPSVF